MQYTEVSDSFPSGIRIHLHLGRFVLTIMEGEFRGRAYFVFAKNFEGKSLTFPSELVEELVLGTIGAIKLQDDQQIYITHTAMKEINRICEANQLPD